MLKYLFAIFILISCNTQVSEDKVTGNDLLTACTQEAKTCPDGSFVGRNIENQCAFDRCPTDDTKPSDNVVCSEDAKVCSDGSFVSRNPYNNCNFFKCSSDEVYCTQEVRTCPDGSFVGRDPSNNCTFLPCEEDSEL